MGLSEELFQFVFLMFATTKKHYKILSQAHIAMEQITIVKRKPENLSKLFFIIILKSL